MNPRKNNPFLRIAPLSLASVVVVAIASAPSLFANTQFDVVAQVTETPLTDPPNLTQAAAYTGLAVPGTTGDITFNATNNYTNTYATAYTPPTGVFSIGAALNVGSLNNLCTTQLITLANGNSGTQAPLTLNGGNSVSGNPFDLIYVATGANLDISDIKPHSGAGNNTVTVNPAISGNFNVAGTATIRVPIASGTKNNLQPNANTITKTGVGTLILSGNGNNFAGMTISGGVLQLGNGGATGRLAIATAIVNDANLTINRSNAVIQGTDFSGAAITGIGSFTQAGAGTTTLNAANTYTGDTNVDAGTLNLAGSLTSDIIVGNLATITGIGSTTGSLTMAAGSNLLANDAGTFAADGVTLEGTTNIVFDGVLPFGQFTLFNYGSGLTGFENLSSNGRLSLVNDTANQRVLATIEVMDLTWNPDVDGTWEIGGGEWNDSNDFYEGDSVSFLEPSAARVVTLAGTVNPESMYVENTSNPYTFSGTGSIGGEAYLDKFGTGALTLGTANTYSGGTYMNDGTLNINNPTALGTGALEILGGVIDNTSGAAVVMTNNIAQFWSTDVTFTGTYDLDMGNGPVVVSDPYPDSTVTISAGTLTIGELTTSGGVGLIKQGPGKLIVGSVGNNATGSVITGVLDVAAGELQISRTEAVGGATGDLTAAGIIGTGTITNGSAAARWLYSNPAEGSFSFDGILANGGTAGLGFYKGGAGTQILTGTNTYTDTTTVNGGELIINGENTGPGTNAVVQSGTLTLGHDQALGTGGTIEMTGNNVASLNLAIDEDVVGAPYPFKASTNNVVTIISNRATEGPGINHTLTNLDPNGLGGATLNIVSGANVTSGSGRITFQQLALGGGSVGTATLNPTTADVTILGPVSKQTNDQSVTLGLSGTTSGNVISGIISNGPALTGANNLSVVKSNTSTWTLSGDNTYTGNTTVNGGTLVISGDNSLATGAVLVGATATLAGNGNLGGNVTISGNGTHALEVALTPETQVTQAIGGTLTYAFTSTLSLSASSQPANGIYTLVTSPVEIASLPTYVNLGTITDGVVTLSGDGKSLKLNIGGVAESDYDTWAAIYDPADLTDMAGDNDNDGLTNQEEYAFGLSPVSGSSVNPITAQLDKGTGTFTYQRRDDALTGLTYKIWYSTDLAAWTEDTTADQDDSAGPDGNGVEPVVVTLTTPPTDTKFFVRVSAE